MAVFNRKKCILSLYYGDENVRRYTFRSVTECKQFILRNEKELNVFNLKIMCL